MLRLPVVFLAFGLIVRAAAGADVQLQTPRGVTRIEARQRDGSLYLKLEDIARGLECATRELDRGTLRLQAPLGGLRLQDGRALVSAPGSDVLLTAPVWRRSRGSWWVPEDFLPRALAPVLSARLSATPSGYRSDPLPISTTRSDPPETSPPTRPAADTTRWAPTGPLVVLDPGHGGADPGLRLEGSDEKHLTLGLAVQLEAALRERGFEVEMTRRRDVDLDSDLRSGLGNRPGAAAFIALHVSSLRGAQVYVYGDPATAEPIFRSPGPLLLWEEAYRPRRLASWQLAQALQLALNASGSDSRRPLEARLDVLRRIEPPAVLIELGPDAGETQSGFEETGRRLAGAIARAIGREER